MVKGADTSAVDQVLRMEVEAAQIRKGKRLHYAFGGDASDVNDGQQAVVSLPGPARDPRQQAEEAGDLQKSLAEAVGPDAVRRIAFEQNPDQLVYHSIYVPKPKFVPEWLLKHVSHTDDLVAAIVRTRATQMRSFGVPRPDRHTVGFVIEPNEGVVDKLDDAAKAALDKRIERAVKRLQTCGSEEGVAPSERMVFADCLDLLTQNAVVVGKVAIEKIRDKNDRLHSFRPVDAGTIFPAAPQQQSAESIRKQAVRLLARLKQEPESQLADTLNLKDWYKDRYSWVQVIEATPKQVFTDDQICVRNFYPCLDVEMQGHPITPLDTVISAVTTHINITTHSKVYFQSGRASKGMLVIRSEDADGETIKYMQHHFQANINNASNAWRMPVFAIGKDDEITWQPIDQAGQRDSEFQYLGDSVARIIMSSFQMSPDELPGWAYLSKGTSAQTLSEGANEYKLEAHRDLGIRPLIRHFEELVQLELLPIVDEGLNEICRFRMTGLDADSAEKEANRLAEDQPLHMTQNQIHEKVEKEPLPAFLAGDVPLSPAWNGIVAKLVTVGVMREFLLKIPGASKDPRFDYIPDPMYFQQQQMLLQSQQMQQQAQLQQQQMQQARQQQAAQKNTGDAAKPGAERPSAPGQGDEAPRADDLQRSVDDAHAALLRSEVDEAELIDLNKAEHHLTPAMRRLLRAHRDMVKRVTQGAEEDKDRALAEILASADDLMQGGEG